MKKEKPVPLHELQMRDFFAAFAMMGILSNPKPELFNGKDGEVISFEILAYNAAALMMKERKSP